MPAIPGEPLDPKQPLLTLKDGRRVVLKVPGLPAPVGPTRTEERSVAEPPRDDVRRGPDPYRGVV